MIHTDGKQTIANAPATRTGASRMAGPGKGPFVPMSELRRRPTASERLRQARDLREAALDAAKAPNRGPQDNGQEWNDGYCACGVAICDSPAGDQCWDCFNHDPSE